MHEIDRILAAIGETPLEIWSRRSARGEAAGPGRVSSSRKQERPREIGAKAGNSRRMDDV